jgi:hypothetical protein
VQPRASRSPMSQNRDMGHLFRSLVCILDLFISEWTRRSDDDLAGHFVVASAAEDAASHGIGAGGLS